MLLESVIGLAPRVPALVVEWFVQAGQVGMQVTAVVVQRVVEPAAGGTDLLGVGVEDPELAVRG